MSVVPLPCSLKLVWLGGLEGGLDRGLFDVFGLVRIASSHVLACGYKM